MVNELSALMEQLGFHRMTSAIYPLVLTEGPITLADMAVKLQQSEVWLQPFLDQLEKLRLIGFDTNKKGKILWYVTNPSIAWTALVADLVWSSVVDLGPIRSLNDTQDPDIESTRQTCLALSIAAQSEYKPHSAAIKHKERDANTVDELARLTCELIYQAKDTIYGLSKTPRLPSVSSFWAVLSDRMGHGVKYTRIVDFDEMVDHGIAVKERDITDYPIELYVLEQAKIKDKLYIVDERLMSIYHQPGQESDSDFNGVGRITNHYHIVKRKTDQYKRHLAQAIPASFVLRYMRDSRDKTLESAGKLLSQDELGWLEDLFQHGRFAKYHKLQKWSESKCLKFETNLRKRGFIIRNNFGDIVPVYNLTEAALRKAFNSAAF